MKPLNISVMTEKVDEKYIHLRICVGAREGIMKCITVSTENNPIFIGEDVATYIDALLSDIQEDLDEALS